MHMTISSSNDYMGEIPSVLMLCTLWQAHLFVSKNRFSASFLSETKVSLRQIMQLLLINPRCLNINLLNGKSCLFWTNLVQQYLFKINSQQTISYLLLIKITDFLFQTAYKPEKLAPAQCAIDSAGALDLDLPPHSEVYKNNYSQEWQIRQREVRWGGKPGGNGWDLSSQCYEVQNGSAVLLCAAWGTKSTQTGTLPWHIKSGDHPAFLPQFQPFPALERIILQLCAKGISAGGIWA